MSIALLLFIRTPSGIAAPLHIPEHLRADGCLTVECHVALAQKIVTATVQHNPIRRGTCKSCHHTHSDTPQQPKLTQPVPELCFSCHVEFGDFIRSSAYLHTPVREGRCTMCHGPHGANGVKLLTKYRPLSENEWVQYGGSPVTLLCMDCHGQEFVLQADTDRLTAFRNGRQNLHTVHVVRKKGRSCKVCHDTHAANQPFHIRPDVAFGTAGWKLPITFTKTQTGGACVVGCHKTMSYDRLHPAEQ